MTIKFLSNRGKTTLIKRHGVLEPGNLMQIQASQDGDIAIIDCFTCFRVGNNLYPTFQAGKLSNGGTVKLELTLAPKEVVINKTNTGADSSDAQYWTEENSMSSGQVSTPQHMFTFARITFTKAGWVYLASL